MQSVVHNFRKVKCHKKQTVIERGKKSNPQIGSNQRSNHQKEARGQITIIVRNEYIVRYTEIIGMVSAVGGFPHKLQENERGTETKPDIADSSQQFLRRKLKSAVISTGNIMIMKYRQNVEKFVRDFLASVKAVDIKREVATEQDLKS